jgi:hypothetical protein
MPIYQSMIESIVNTDGGYTPGVSWLYDPRTSAIRIDWLPGFDEQGQSDQARVAGALNDGWHGEAIWAYYATSDSYNGYTTIRTVPEPLLAPNLQAAAEAMLRRMTTKTRTR